MAVVSKVHEQVEILLQSELIVYIAAGDNISVSHALCRDGYVGQCQAVIKSQLLCALCHYHPYIFLISLFYYILVVSIH